MRLRKATSVALCLAAGLAGAACGSDEEGKPIPTDSARALDAQLDNIDARLANGSAGACNDVLRDEGGNVQPVEQLISNLPDDVDEDVLSALSEGFDRLFQLVQERCTQLEGDREKEQQEEEEPEITIPEETVPEETEPETVPPETETETAPEDPGLPPGQDGELPPGQDGENPGQGGGGGAIVPEEDG